jgi:chitinase
MQKLALIAVVAMGTAVAPDASAAVCTGVADYSNTTIYNPGNRAVFKSHLWEAVIQIWNTPPDYCPSCNWWRDLGACDGTGGGGGNDTTPPTVPGSLASPTRTDTTITLSWSASTDAGGIQNYDVRRNNTVVGTATGTSFTDTGLTPDTAFTYAVRARDNAGNVSAFSPSITVRTAAVPPVITHFITGYWQNFNNGARVVKLRDVPAGYNVIAVAFADATTTQGAVAFNLDPGLGYANVQEFKNDIATLHGQGRKVIISVGGQNGTISVASSTAATAFRNSIVDLMNQFGFDGVDIDLENGVNSTFMSQALHSIASAHANTIITLAPQTLDMQNPGTEYFKLALNIKDVLTVVNMQYYNSGTMLGCDQQVYAQGTVNFLTALACIQLQNGLRPDQVGLGLPASTAAAGGGFVDPSVVNAALDCLTTGNNCGSFHPPQRWPGIRGAMTWSINHDGTNSFRWVNTVAGHINSVP